MKQANYNEKEFTTIKEFDKTKLYEEVKRPLSKGRKYRVDEIHETYLILRVVSNEYDNNFSRKVSKKVFLNNFKEL